MNITVQNQSRTGCVSKGDKYSPNNLGKLSQVVYLCVYECIQTCSFKCG